MTEYAFETVNPTLAHWLRAIVIVLNASSILLTTADAFQLVSVPDASSSSVGGGGDSGTPIISADGRYVLFTSTAENLVLISNNPSVNIFPLVLNAFVHDRLNNSNSLVSVNLAGTGGGNGDSFPVGISTNGQYVLFESTASNLVTNDTNNASDVFLRDQVNGVTSRVSVSADGGNGNGGSRNAVMTPDGRFVAFVSAASNLVAGDTNMIPDVFVRDMQTATTTLVSVGAISTNFNSATPGSSESPVITPDGRYVAFFSTATNLLPGVKSSGDVYVRDMVAGTTAWASINARTIFLQNVGKSNAVACNQRISDDGQFVAFLIATNNPTGFSARGVVVRYNLQTGFTDLVHTNAHTPPIPFETIHNLDMTPDGRFIAFVANVTKFSGTNTAVYLWDALTGTNVLVSINTNGVANPAAICDSPTVSTNGQFVAFLSSSTDLITNALAGDYHLYVRDAVSNVTQLVDTDLTGVGSGVSSTTVPSLNASGQLVAFECANANLVLNDRNHGFEVFVRDTMGDVTELVSGHHPSLPSVTPNGLSGFSFFTISGNGRYAAFASEADDLVANDTNGLRDVFMRDLLTGSNVLVSVGANGFAAAGLSTEPAISGDGRYVTFSSFATNLIASDTNTSENIFLRDLQSGTTTLVSASINGMNPGNKDSYLPSISADGRYVLFHSKASNLAAGSFTGTENLFLRDLQTSTTYALTTNGLVTASMTPDGHFVAFVDSAGSSVGKIYLWNTQLATLSTINVSSIVTNISISPDGSQLASYGGSALRVVNLISSSNVLVAAGNLNSRSGLQFSGNGSCLVYSLTTTNQVFLYDLQAGTNLLVSKSFNSSAGASGVSDSPAISADERFVIYRSTATNIVANVASDFPNLFLFDRQTGANSLLTQCFQNGAPANNRSRTPVFSGNGRAVIFQSSASDIVAGDFNNAGDLLLYEFLYLDITPGNSPLIGPTLSWPATPEQTYEVQYKNALDESNWQDVVGIVTILGNRAYLTDASPAPDQRFYRVIAY